MRGSSYMYIYISICYVHVPCIHNGWCSYMYVCVHVSFILCVFAQLFSYHFASEPVDPNNTDKNAEKIEPMPSLADIKRVITEHCILPLGKVWYWFVPIRTVQNVLIIKCLYYEKVSLVHIEATLYMYMIVICALLYMYMYMYLSSHPLTWRVNSQESWTEHAPAHGLQSTLMITIYM